MTDTVTIRGRLVFRQAGEFQPVHHLRLEVRTKVFAGVHTTMAFTDFDGRFEATVPASAAQLEIAWFDTEHKLNSDSTPLDSFFEVGAIVRPISKGVTELGEIAIGFWPYRTDAPSPRADLVDGKLVQAYSKGYKHTLELAIAKQVPTALLTKGELVFAGNSLTMAEIQKHYPPRLTTIADAKSPGVSRSDEWLADQLLNGFDIGLHIGRDADDASKFRVVIRWDVGASKIDDVSYDVTNVDVTIEERGDKLAASRIRLETLSPDGKGGWKAPVRLDVATGDSQWEQAKRIVRCQYLLHGAIEGHIGYSHFQTEQNAVAVNRNVRRNPIRRVLWPHLQEIIAQDHDVDGFAWGPTGILVTQSGLQTRDLWNMFVTRASVMCWSTFTPRSVLHPTHRYAKAANLFWELVGDYLGEFFSQNRIEIEKEWGEVLRLSNDLTEHSHPYRAEAHSPAVVPVDLHERDRTDVPRTTTRGVLRAVRPITTTAAPASGDLERLQRFCQYAIYQATFNHSWTHDGQTDASGELAYATFGLRNGSLGDVADTSINPPPKQLVESLSFNALGDAARYGLLLADEEHDVPSALRSALENKREAFESLGVNVSLLRSRINI
jgi:hypothetical protein